MSAMTTTRAADGAMTTTVPGAPAGGFNPMGLFEALIKQRLRGPSSVPAAAVVPVGIPENPSLGVSRGPSGSSGPVYTPQLGSAPVEKEISRWVPDPFANPYQQLQTGAKPQAVRERMINGKWEFSDVRPQGGSGGIQGGGTEPAGPSNLRGSREQMEADFDSSMGSGSRGAASSGGPNPPRNAPIAPSLGSHVTSGAEAVSRIPGMTLGPVKTYAGGRR